jgi:hypothetical protein
VTPKLSHATFLGINWDDYAVVAQAVNI